MRIEIDLKNLKTLTKKAKEFVTNPEVEKDWIEIREAIKALQAADKEIAEHVVKEGKKGYGPHFSNVRGDRIVFSYSQGVDVKIKDGEEVAEDLMKTELKLDKDKVMRIYLKSGQLPKGVETVKTERKSVRVNEPK